MKKLNKQLSQRVLRALNKDANFKDVYQMVLNRSKTKPYLVGGKLYRTLVETVYSYPARAHSCDFDFAAEEVIRKKRKKKIATHDGTYDVIEVDGYSNESIKMTSQYGCSIDLIDIPSLKGLKGTSLPPTIEGYMESVPLSIQAIAMDLEKCEIFGKVGIDSLNEKFVWINNQKSLNGYAKHKGWRDGQPYLQKKANSFRFGCDEKVKLPKKNHGYQKYRQPTWGQGQFIDFPTATSTQIIDWTTAAQPLTSTATGAMEWANTFAQTAQVVQGAAAPTFNHLINSNSPATYMFNNEVHANVNGEVYRFDGTDWVAVTQGTAP